MRSIKGLKTVALLIGCALTVGSLAAQARAEAIAGETLLADIGGAYDDVFLLSRHWAPDYRPGDATSFVVRYYDADYVFFSQAGGGGVQSPSADLPGPQLFAGTVDAPEFNEGTYVLDDGTPFRLTAPTDVVFELEGAHTARFVLPFWPSYSTYLDTLTIGPFTGTFDGAPMTFQALNLYNGNARLELVGGDGQPLVDLLTSPLVFRGYFLPGGAYLTDASGNDYGLSITPIQWIGGGAPEPSAWMLMIAGFGLTGAAIRRRRRLVREDGCTSA
jgi:hypothetical protein